MTRHPAAYIVAEDDLTAADCEPNDILARIEDDWATRRSDGRAS